MQQPQQHFVERVNFAVGAPQTASDVVALQRVFADSHRTLISKGVRICLRHLTSRWWFVAGHALTLAFSLIAVRRQRIGLRTAFCSWAALIATELGCLRYFLARGVEKIIAEVVAKDFSSEKLPVVYSKPGNTVCAVRSDGGMIVGCSCVLVGVDATTYGHALGPAVGNQEGRITRVGVLPQFEGHGIGKACVLECVKAAREMNLTALRLSTTSIQERAVGMYEKLGFVVVKRERVVPLLGIDVIAMSLKLA